MKYQVILTRKSGLDVYAVQVNDKTVATFWSQEYAITALNKIMNSAKGVK